MDLQRSYDAVAEEYARRLYQELEHKPFDRKMLDWLIEKTVSGGLICDMGCGPGQIAAYLSQRGARARGPEGERPRGRYAGPLHVGQRSMDLLRQPLGQDAVS